MKDFEVKIYKTFKCGMLISNEFGGDFLPDEYLPQIIKVSQEDYTSVARIGDFTYVLCKEEDQEELEEIFTTYKYLVNQITKNGTILENNMEGVTKEEFDRYCLDDIFVNIEVDHFIEY